ncbi:MAG: hypothetical protein VB071_07360 [Lawsonibacter sp.]|nr:hypothetical protein [Lawsonibacter sp.]
MKPNTSFWWIVGGIGLTVVSFIAMPPLIQKISNAIYKQGSKTDNIDFDNLGPEIVKRNISESTMR